MRREQLIGPVRVQRVHDEHMGRGGVALGRMVVDAGRAPLQAFERGGKRQRVAADLRAQPVGLVFARPADRHLHQHRRHGRQDRDKQRTGETERAVAPAAEEEAEIREHRDRARNRRGDRHDERVAVLHMRKLMRHHAFHLPGRQGLQEPRRGGDGGVLRVAPGGEGVGLVVAHDIDARHRQVRPLRQPPHHRAKLRRAPFVYFLGAVHGEQHPVRIPPGEGVHAERHDKRDTHAGGTAQQVADGEEQAGQAGEQDRGAGEVRHGRRGSAWQGAPACHM